MISHPTTRTARGLLFDMDGTLLLSHAVVEAIWEGFALRHGIGDVHAILRAGHGRQLRDVVSLYAPPSKVAVEIDQMLAQELVNVEGIVPVEGAHDFLCQLPQDCWGIVTSAPRAIALARLKAAGIVPPAVFLTAEDVTVGKPDPEGYIKAAGALGLSPSEIIIFEDAPAGLEAGRRAGAQVVHINSLPDYAIEHDGLQIAGYHQLLLQRRGPLFEITLRNENAEAA